MTPEQVRDLDELPFWSAPFGLLLFETIRIRKNIRALDIGSGTGFPLLELAGRLDRDSRVIGVDPWTEGVRLVENKIRLRGIANAEIHAIAAESLPFESADFDLIVSNNGLNNVQDLSKVLSECRRVCKPDGQLVFTVNLPDTMIEFYRIFEQVLEEEGLPQAIQRMHQHIDAKRKPMNEMETMLAHSGFKVERKKLSSFTYRFADAHAMFDYFMIREFFLPSWKEIVPEERFSALFTKVEYLLNDLAASQGEVRLTIPFVCVDCSCIV